MNSIRRIVAITCLLTAAACGEGPPTLQESAGEPELEPATPEDAAEYIADHDAVPMPWSRVLHAGDLDGATIADDRIVFANRPSEEIEVGDVLVSAQPEEPFLRKVLDVAASDEEYVVMTRPAELGEAVYKGTIRSTQLDQSNGTLRQQLGGTEPSKDALGRGTIRSADGEKKDAEGPVKFTIDPSVSIDSAFYFDLKLEPNAANRSERVVSGTRECSTEADCYPDLQLPAYERNVCTTGGTCGVEKSGPWNYTTCDEVIAALDYAEKEPGCRAEWEKFYDGEVSRFGIDSRACSRGYWILRGRVAYPPHPAEVDWAKDNCRGGLKRFVIDYEVSAEPTTGDIGIEVGADGSGEKVLYEAEKQLRGHLFFIGWLPVYVTVNATFDVHAAWDLKAVMASFHLDPVSVSGLRIGTGIAYYDDEEYEDDRGVMVGGEFVPFSKNEYGSWHATPLRTPDPGFGGLSIPDQDVWLGLGVEAGVKLAARPGLNLLLYDIAGPFVEPFSPYGEVRAGSGIKLSARGENEEPFDSCGPETNVCVRVGAEGKIGIDATRISEKARWDTDLYGSGGTCSDFCPAHDELPLCWKKCAAGDGTDHSLEIELRWSSEQVDLDLGLVSPVAVDYQDRENSGSYYHVGDVCPSDFGSTCVDEREGGYYREYIRIDDSEGMPSSNTRHTIEVEMFKLDGTDTFDLIVRQNDEDVASWTDQATGEEGEVKTFDFVTDDPS